MRRSYNLVQRQVEVLTDIRQRQASRPVHPRVAVDIDHPRPLPKKRVKRRLEPGVPVEDVDVDVVDRIEAHIALGESIGEPFGTRIVRGAVDDARNVVLGYKALC